MASSLTGTSGESLTEAVLNASEALDQAKKHDLEAEVVATAMIWLKENPDKSIFQALEVGMGDWDL